MKFPHGTVYLLFAALGSMPGTGRSAPSSCGSFLEAGNAAYAAFDNTTALERFRQAYRQCPADYEPLMKMTRAIIDNGEGATPEKSTAYFEQGFRYADSMQIRYPDSSQSYFLMAVAAGNLARSRGPEKRVALARVIERNCLKSIELAPSFAPAYVVLGAYYREVATAGTLQILAANILFGGIPTGTLRDSKQALLKALSLAPQNVYALLEIARTDIAMGNKPEAVQFLERMKKAPCGWHLDNALKIEGLRLLSEMLARTNRR
jgi:tetratricopeptide (TPR) repeat protein